MGRFIVGFVFRVFSTTILLICVAPLASPCRAAIQVGHVDDFQDGTTQHWRIGQVSTFPTAVADSGPQGAGDFALFSTNVQAGSASRLVVINESNQAFPGPADWQGDWTAAGVTQIALDVRNPGVVQGASDLTMRLGIAGAGGTGAFGDVYVTDGISVPADNAWHSITFDVRPPSFNVVGSGNDFGAALANVTQFRILSNSLEEFPGSSAPNEFYLDNIRAIGAPAMLAGDYNQNGAVDAADYVLWRDAVTTAVTPGAGADGTGPGGVPDGVVDVLDYDFWQARFGATAPSSGGLLQVAEVPEPAALTLFVLGGTCWLAIGGRRRPAWQSNRYRHRDVFVSSSGWS